LGIFVFVEFGYGSHGSVHSARGGGLLLLAFVPSIRSVLQRCPDAVKSFIAGGSELWVLFDLCTSELGDSGAF